MKKAYLSLENGKVFEGSRFGAEGEVYGEVVFNTSLTGYQEILTDPSYNGQIVVMTYPEIGNYGVNSQDLESRKPHVRGFVVKEYCNFPSNWRAEDNLENFLIKHGILGIQEIDTRELTKIIRTEGALRGVISTKENDISKLIKKAKESQSIVGIDLVSEVSRTTVDTNIKFPSTNPYASPSNTKNNEKKYKVVAYDFGIKSNILRQLYYLGCEITAVPSKTNPEDILKMNPDGIFLSNGPGDPAAVKYASKNVQELIGKKPIFGICLGHQILSLSLGGETFKLKFGHRGAIQPVKNLNTDKVEITAQNHGFAVDPDSLGNKVRITHINLNDQTVEGIKHKEYPLFSVQYHPEASPGPHDSSYLFKEFINLMDECKNS